MKIVAVASHTHAVPLARPYTITFRHVDRVELSVVTLTDDHGHVGVGAASPEPFVTGETPEACQKALAPDALAWLVGRAFVTPTPLARALGVTMHATPAACAAVDIALHDLWAQRLGVPLVEALGRAHDALPTSITIGIKPTDEALREADEYTARGFCVLKIKLGHGCDEDIDRVRCLRAHVGRDVVLRVDPNQGFTPDETVRFFKATAALDLELVEQPVKVARTDDLRALPEDLRARVVLDEAVLTPADALRFLAPPRAAGGFNIKLMKCGGVHAAGQLAAIGEAAGARLMWGCMDESRISIAAALHAALASPATRYLDLDGSFDLARDVAEGGFSVEPGGVLRPLPRPGLGVTVLG